MGSAIRDNDGFPGTDGKIQRGSQVDEKIPLSLTYIQDSLFSIDSDPDHRASDG